MLSDRTQEASEYCSAGSPSDSDVLVWGTTYATEICGDRQRLVSYDSAECAAGSTRALPSHDGTIVATHRIVRRAESVNSSGRVVCRFAQGDILVDKRRDGPLPMDERIDGGRRYLSCCYSESRARNRICSQESVQADVARRPIHDRSWPTPITGGEFGGIERRRRGAISRRFGSPRERGWCREFLTRGASLLNRHVMTFSVFYGE